MARPLRRDHDHVHIGAGNHLVVMHIEAMSKGQRSALLHVCLNFAVINGRDSLVGHQQHYDVRIFHRLGDFLYLEAGLLGLAPGSPSLAQADCHLDAGIIEVLCMSMALRTVADDSDLFALDEGKVGVLVVINFHWFSLNSEFRL